MRSTRAEWQDEADGACADAVEAGIGYGSAKQKLEEASERESEAAREVEHAKAEVESARTEVRSARDALAAAKSARRGAGREQRAAASAAVAAAEAALSDAKRSLSEAELRLSQAKRRLTEAEQHKVAAEHQLVEADREVDRARSHLKELLATTQGELSRVDAVPVAAGPVRFATHFGEATQVRTEETGFLRALVEQHGGAIASLDATVERMNRPHELTSAWIGQSSSAGNFGRLPPLSGISGGYGYHAPAYTSALPALSNLPGFVTSPSPYLGTAGSYPSLGTPRSGWANPLLSTLPLPTTGLTTARLGESPAWPTPLGFGTAADRTLGLGTSTGTASSFLPPAISGGGLSSLGPVVSTPLPGPFIGEHIGGSWDPIPQLSFPSAGLSSVGPAVSTPPPGPLIGGPLGGSWDPIPQLTFEQRGAMLASGGTGNMEVAPIVSSWDGGAVFQGAGHSHFTFAPNDPGWHVTTEIPGGYSDRIDVSNFGGDFALDGAGMGWGTCGLAPAGSGGGLALGS